MFPSIVWGLLQSSDPHSLPNPATLNPSNFHERQPCEPWTNSVEQNRFEVFGVARCVFGYSSVLWVYPSASYLQNNPKLSYTPLSTIEPFTTKIDLASTAKLMTQLSVTCHHWFHWFQWPPRVPSKFGGIRDTWNIPVYKSTSLVPPTFTNDVSVYNLKSLLGGPNTSKCWGKRGGSFIAMTTVDDLIIFCKIKWKYSETVRT